MNEHCTSPYGSKIFALHNSRKEQLQEVGCKENHFFIAVKKGCANLRVTLTRHN